MVCVKHTEIGKGLPKICVPIVEKSDEMIIKQAEKIADSVADIAEWRIDFYENVFDSSKLIQLAGEIQGILKDIPLLVTFRTAKEGGEKEISFAEYRSLLMDVAKSGKADMIDVETFRVFDGIAYDVTENGCIKSNSETSDKTESGSKKDKSDILDKAENEMKSFVKELKSHAVIVGSYHDFDKTPEITEIKGRLCFMKNAGVNIPKMAVMPRERKDVIRLMEATLSAKEVLADTPVITMSMGQLGKITRAACDNFGSAVTFGCIGKESAPGQIESGELSRLLEIFSQEA